MKPTFLFGLMLLAGAAACGGGGGSGNGGGGSTGTTTSSGGAGGSTGTGASDVACTGGAPSFPTFDKTCAAEADCIVAFHQINCCGTREAIGINKSQAADFATAETACENQYPGCGCAQGPTMTDEGSTAVDESLIKVQCTAGECQSYVP